MNKIKKMYLNKITNKYLNLENHKLLFNNISIQIGHILKNHKKL